MKRYLALMIAGAAFGCLLSACATGWPPPPTAPACVFIERCRNPALTTPGGD